MPVLGKVKIKLCSLSGMAEKQVVFFLQLEARTCQSKTGIVVMRGVEYLEIMRTLCQS